MRVWDLPLEVLRNRHLLAEHNEIHVIWNVITLHRRGFSRHPETQRWRGRLPGLHGRLRRRCGRCCRGGFHHLSPLPPATGPVEEPDPLEPVEAQAARLRARSCGCYTEAGATE